MHALKLANAMLFLSTLSLRRATQRFEAQMGEFLFLSTLSLRRATHNTANNYTDYCDFYPRSPCGERLDVNNPVFAVTSISIHALLAESDRMYQLSPKAENISIHALLAESDYMCPIICTMSLNFYPRSPCGERRVEGDNFFYYADISIHALLAESDSLWVCSAGLKR